MRRPRFFQPAKADLAPSGELGLDGDIFYNKYAAGGLDDNAAWSGTQRFWTADEMVRTDPSVKSLHEFWGLPVRSASWGFQPPAGFKNDPEAKLISDACSWQFGLDDQLGPLDLSWDELNVQALRMLIDGAVLEELVWEKPAQLHTWYDRDGDAHAMQPLIRIAPRPAKTISRVVFDRGRVTEVVQNIAGTSPIPGEKISYLVWERTPGLWHGESMLRPAWGAWYFKKQIMIAFGIAWDRFATSIPIIYRPDTPDAAVRAKQIGQNLRTHESARVDLPGKKGDDWEIDLVKGQMDDATPALRYFSEQIAEAGLQQFTRQGLGQTGARATAMVQADPYYLAVQALARLIARKRREQVVYKFVCVNFGQEAADRKTPVLTVSKIQSKNLEVITNAIEILAPLGLTIVADDWNDLREEIGFSALDEDDMERRGLDPETLIGLLNQQGLDSTVLAQVEAALNAEGFTIARNTVGPLVQEGDGLPVPA